VRTHWGERRSRGPATTRGPPLYENATRGPARLENGQTNTHNGVMREGFASRCLTTTPRTTPQDQTRIRLAGWHNHPRSGRYAAEVCGRAGSPTLDLPDLDGPRSTSSWRSWRGRAPARSCVAAAEHDARRDLAPVPAGLVRLGTFSFPSRKGPFGRALVAVGGGVREASLLVGFFLGRRPGVCEIRVAQAQACRRR
jgi:hypothetical protein